MRKYLVIIIFTHAVFVSGLSQNIDSLRKVLPTLHDSARVDCLTALSVPYFKTGKKDSVELYVSPAYEEAKKINYYHGIAQSLTYKAVFERFFTSNYLKEEELAREALFWYNKTPNKKDICHAYFELGFALFVQSDYDEAIKNLEMAFLWSKKEGNEFTMLQSVSFLGQVYRESGEYGKAFDVFEQGLQLGQARKNIKWTLGEYINIGDLYMAIEDYPTALSYYGKVIKNTKREDIGIWDYTTYAELFTLTHQYDSALHYYNYFDSTKDIRDLRIFLTGKGEYFLLRKEYDNALQYFLNGLAYHQQLNDRNQIKRTLIDIAKTYADKENNIPALKYAREGLNMAIQTKSKQYMRDAYQILYSVYDRLHQIDSAYFYYSKYIAMKDVVLSDQVKGKFAAYSYEQRIASMNKEKEINQQQLKIQEEHLNEESFLKNVLIGGVIVLLLLGIVMYRNLALKRKNEKLENQKIQSELQLKASELEMQALRAQMNPHFIFNCLSSINRFILKNETEAASDYLTKFSRLIRMVLTNSNKPFISLEDELDMLRLYLDMERLRFKNSFDYSISFTNSIDAGNVFIPPLLLQPFIENAIWHGLMHKEGQGHIEIELSTDKRILTCIISDNGIGRSKSAMFKSKSAEKQKSMGLRITTERLALLNLNADEKTFFNVEDITDDKGNTAGTRVILKMNYRGLMEVLSDNLTKKMT